MLLRGTYGDTTPFFTMTNDVNSFIFGYLIEVQVSLMLQEIALIDNKVLPQTLSISFIFESQQICVCRCGRVYSK